MWFIWIVAGFVYTPHSPCNILEWTFNPLFNGLNFAFLLLLFSCCTFGCNDLMKSEETPQMHQWWKKAKIRNKSTGARRLAEIKWLPPASRELGRPWWKTKRLRMLRRLPLEGRLMSGTVQQVLNTRVSVVQTVGSWDCSRASFSQLSTPSGTRQDHI